VPVTYLPQPPLVNQAESLHPPVYVAMADSLAEIPEEVLLASEYAQWHRLYLLTEEAQAFTADSEAEAMALYEQAMQAFKAEQDHILVIQQATADGSLIALLYHYRENGVYGHFTPEGAMLPWSIWQPDSQARLVLLPEGTQPALTYNPEDGLWYLFQLAEGVPQGVYIPHTAQWIPTNEAGEPQMVWNSETQQFEYDVPPIPESEKAMLAFVEHHGGVLHKPDKNDPNDTYYYHVTKQITTAAGEERQVDLRLIEYDPVEGWEPSYETWDRLFSQGKLGTLSALMDVEKIIDAPFFIRAGEKGKEDMKRVWNMQFTAYEQLVGLNDDQTMFNFLPVYTLELAGNKPGINMFRQKTDPRPGPIVHDGVDITRPHATFMAQQPEGSATQALVLVASARGFPWFCFNQAEVIKYRNDISSSYSTSFADFVLALRNPRRFQFIGMGYVKKQYLPDGISPLERNSQQLWDENKQWTTIASRKDLLESDYTNITQFISYELYAKFRENQ
jgi:hypothetical protein